MHHPASAIADFYDHETESALERRRDAPDWGGDDLFTTTPRRRRFERPSRGEHVAPRIHEGLYDTTEHPLQRSMALAAGRAVPRAAGEAPGREPAGDSAVAPARAGARPDQPRRERRPVARGSEVAAPGGLSPTAE